MIISLMGKKQSGKDTSADYLVSRHGFMKKSFADPLKKACKEMFLFTDDQLYGPVESKEKPDSRWFGCSPRSALQFVGTELFRNHLDKIMPGLGQNIFVHHFKLWFEEERNKNPNLRVVISDNRFINEAEFVKSLGGQIVKLYRPGLESMHNADGHQSETELDSYANYDLQINNNSTKEGLYDCLDTFINVLNARTLGIVSD